MFKHLKWQDTLMTRKFDIEIVEYKKISSIQNAWTTQDYTAILELMENDDVAGMSDSDIKEMCLMALNDLEAEEAATIVLTYLLDGAVTAGKISQMAHQMPDDKLWEEFADPLFHERLFNAYELLREAFNGVFAKPTGVIMRLTIKAENELAQQQFKKSPKVSLVRILSKGLDDSSLLNRLYEEQIAGEHFEEAEGIIWKMTPLTNSGLQTEYEITSSQLWLEDLEGISPFKASIPADALEE